MPLSPKRKKGKIRAEKEAMAGTKIELKKKRSRELPSTNEKKILETKQIKRLKSGGWHENQQLNISPLQEEIKF